ncbi:MAG: DUF1588 domain-containing protein [Myxococcales bacterium]
MMRPTTGALTLALALMACGGRFDADRHGAGGSAEVATSGSAGVGASNVGAGASVGVDGGSPGVGGSTATAGMPATDELGPSCVASGEPPPLTGPFAPPAVVWSRISMLTWGTPMGPMPLPMPATTTYEWAGSMVTFALLDVKNTTGGARGLESVLRQWLDLTPDAPFKGPWGDYLLNGEPALHVLLLTPFFEPERLGIFTEPSWLAEHSSISARGTSFQNALLSPVPTPPAGVKQMLTPEPNVSDRQALEAATQTPVCVSCHRIIDPPGFALGHFDAKGSYRKLDQGLPIDTTGSLSLFNSGVEVSFDGFQDLNAKLVDSCAANSGFADAFLRVALALNGVSPQAQSDFGEENGQRVRQGFLNHGRTYEALVKAYIQSPAGLYP